MWYDGGWNQFIAPFALNLLPTVVAAISGFGVARAFVNGGVHTRRFDPVITLLAACSLAGAAAVLILARISMQAEGRIAYVGLSSFAVLARLLGLAELSAVLGGGMSRPVDLACCFTRI